jgi:hypothetical protein
MPSDERPPTLAYAAPPEHGAAQSTGRSKALGVWSLICFVVGAGVVVAAAYDAGRREQWVVSLGAGPWAVGCICAIIHLRCRGRGIVLSIAGIALNGVALVPAAYYCLLIVFFLCRIIRYGDT